MRLSSILCKHATIEHHFTKLNPLFRKHARQATTNAEEMEKDIITQEKMFIKRPELKKWKRPPFVKNMFLGKFDIHLLPFPEILDITGVMEMDRSAKKISDAFKSKVDPRDTDRTQKLPEHFMQDLKEMGIFGRLVPTDYGGMGLTFTQFVRLNEALSLDWSIGSTLCMNELLGIQALLHFGSDEQKAKYIPDLASGKKTVAFCCHEYISGSDVLSMKTRAFRSQDWNSYIINGSKDWITNVMDADLYIVFAQDIVFGCPSVGTLTAFLIEKNTKGIEIVPTTDKATGLGGVNYGSMHFTDVIVPKEHILGTPKMASLIMHKVQELCKFGIGSMTFPLLKSLLDNVTEYIIDAERLEVSLSTQPIIKRKLSLIACTIYAMESLAYFTAGIYDSTVDPDCLLETNIVKIFNTEGTLYCLREMMSLMSCYGLTSALYLEKYYRDAQALMILEGGNDLARLQIGLIGCQFVGGSQFEDIEKYRNPFFYPLEKVKRHWRSSRISHQKFNYDHNIAGHLHPSFVSQGNELEECLQRFQFLAEHVLVTNGAKIVETQFEPMMLADLAINLYARTAVLSRCSRSYCIGHKHAGFEMTIAYTFCDLAQRKFKDTFTDIAEGAIKNCCDNHLDIGDYVAFTKGYFPEHPLKYNF